MDVTDILEKARSSFGPERVYGQPYERDGLVVIPAAKVAGGGGGGADDTDEGGGGGGFGVRARPAGALVIDADGSVSWKVPFDFNRVILGGQLVGVAFFLFVWLTKRSEAKAAAKAAVAAAVVSRRVGPRAD